MTIKGYSSVEEVQALVGMSFDETQEDQVLRLIESAESFIDWATGRDNWGSSNPIVDEYYEMSGPRLYLKSSPVTSVESVSVGTNNLVGTVALVATVNYDLVDKTNGLLILSQDVWDDSYYNYALVSYTPQVTLPAHLKLAASQLVAHWLTIHFDPARLSYSLYTLGDGDLSARPIAGIPKETLDLLDTFRKGGIVFA